MTKVFDVARFLRISSVKLFRIAVAAALILLMEFQTAVPLVAQGPVTLLTFGLILQDLQSTLGALMNQAQNTGTNLTLVIGAQLSAEIDLAKQEFSTELDLQEAQLSAQASMFLNNLRSTLSDLQSSTFAKAQDLVNQLQLVAITLPFSNKTPMLRAFSPFVASVPPNGVDDLVFTVGGVFPNVGDPSYNPTLTFNGKPYNASSVTSLSAEFHVPKTDITFPAGHTLQSIQATVSVPYSKSCVLFFHCREVSTFNEVVGLLPLSPGNLHLSITDITQKTDSKVVSSPHMHQDASGGDDKNHSQTYAADPGWQVIRDSVHITVDAAEGDVAVDFNNGNCSTTTMACWQVTTIQHHCIAFICPQGHDGSVNFHLSFAETQTVNASNTWNGDVGNLAWNQTTLEGLPSTGAVTFAGTYTDFNGQSYPFGSNNTSVNSPWIKIDMLTPTSIAFSFYPFNVDAGADISSIAANPRYNQIVSQMETTNGILPNHNLNPLTARGYVAAQGFLAEAISNTAGGAAPATVGNLNVSHFSDAFAEVEVGTPTPAPGGPPPQPPSPQQTAVQQLQTSMANNGNHTM